MNRTTIVSILLSTLIAGTIGFQLIKAGQFISKGPRFTAQDGQQLCQRIQHLERRAGLPVEPCLFPHP